MDILGFEEATIKFEKCGFRVVNVDRSGCDGVYHFRMWAEKGDLRVGIMQFINKSEIDLHVFSIDGKPVWIKNPPFNGKCKAYPKPDELTFLLEKIASGELSRYIDI